jgi:hypothetical protein
VVTHVHHLILLVSHPKFRECLIAVPLLEGLVEAEVVGPDLELGDQVLVEEQVLRDLMIVPPDAQGVIHVVLVNVIEDVRVFGRNGLDLEDARFELEDRLDVEVVVQEVGYHAVTLVKDEFVLESDNVEVLSILLVELLQDYFPELVREVVVDFDGVAPSGLVDDLRYLISQLVVLVIVLEEDDVFFVVLVLPLAHRV